MKSAARAKSDAVTVQAVDAAREALVADVGPGEVGEPLGHMVEGDRLVTHYFAATRAGYRGWRWAVTLVRASRARHVTVDEIVLLPGDDAIVAPDWVPYRERIQPGDLSPGDLLPVAEDDPRLVPTSAHAVRSYFDALAPQLAHGEHAANVLEWMRAPRLQSSLRSTLFIVTCLDLT